MVDERRPREQRLLGRNRRHLVRLPVGAQEPGERVSALPPGDEQQAVATLNTALADQVDADLDVVVGGTTVTVVPSEAGLGFDADATVEGYAGRIWNPVTLLTQFTGGPTIDPVVTVDETRLEETVATLAAEVDSPAVEPTIAADVSFLDDNLSLVPLPGPAVSVDTAVETDPERTVVRLAERPTPGDVVGVVANAPATVSDAVDLGAAPRLVDESTAGFTQLAEGLAGDGAPLEQLSQLEVTMREDFVLDSQVQGGGLEQALIDRFLRDTQRGTNEQFATSFVLLARSLGIEARVATGFVAGGDSAVTVSAPGEPVVLSSADADVWPEIQLTDGSWLAYDPVPDGMMRFKDVWLDA